MAEKKAFVSDKEIIAKAKELANLISESEEVDFFKRAEAQINQNQKVQDLIQKIKQKQKEAVSLEHLGQTDLLQKVDKEIEQLQKELEQIPIVREFQQSQTDVNDLIQMISNIISNTVTDNIIRSTGGDLLHGKTGSALKNGPSCGL